LRSRVTSHARTPRAGDPGDDDADPEERTRGAIEDERTKTQTSERT